MKSKPSIVRYSGTFRFRDRALLEQALERARARIDEEQELAALEGGWLRCFVMLDNTLTVNVALPGVRAHQDAAVEVFSLLSREAMDGEVTATMDNVAIEYYSVRARVSSPTEQAPE